VEAREVRELARAVDYAFAHDLVPWLKEVQRQRRKREQLFVRASMHARVRVCGCVVEWARVRGSAGVAVSCGRDWFHHGTWHHPSITPISLPQTILSVHAGWCSGRG